MSPDTTGGHTPPVFTPADRDRAIAHLEDAVARLREIPVQTPCRLCARFYDDGNWCDHWGAPVPPEYQGQGCDQWEEGIPF